MELSGYNVTGSGIDFNPTPEQVQKAKDFIWDYMDAANQELVLYHLNKRGQEGNAIEVKKITIGYQYH